MSVKAKVLVIDNQLKVKLFDSETGDTIPVFVHKDSNERHIHIDMNVMANIYNAVKEITGKNPSLDNNVLSDEVLDAATEKTNQILEEFFRQKNQ